MCKELSRLKMIVFLIIAITLAASPTQAQNPPGEEYIVQAGDWLTKIADKYYGDPQDYTLIVEGTNVRAGENSEYVTITDPNYIEVGQKVWVPLKEEAGIINVGDSSFKSTPIDNLGVSTVVPAVWPAVTDDAFLQNTWRAGPFSFVTLSATPGNDARVGVARLLGVTRDDLDSQVLGGQLSEIEVNDRPWTIYTLNDGATSSIAAATVQDKVIYQINLFAVSPQAGLILETMLDNFEIIDPSAAQQTVTLEAPAPGTQLPDPFELRGVTTQYPFRGSLVYRVLDAEGNQVGRGPFEVVGRVGNPATFAVAARYEVQTEGPGTVEVAEVSAADGTIIAIDSVAVTLAADPPGYDITIDDPGPYANVSSPVQIRGKTSDRPLEGMLNYRIIDAAGDEISRGFLQASGSSGQANLYDGFAEFVVSVNGPGRIEVFDINETDGSTLTLSTVNVWLTTSP